MNTFEIIVSLNNTKRATSFTVVPHDNHENSYSTYFQLLKDNKLYSEIRLNNDLIWEACKGNDLSQDDIQIIVTEIESNFYKRTVNSDQFTSKDNGTDKSHHSNWFEKLVNTIIQKESAA